MTVVLLLVVVAAVAVAGRVLRGRSAAREPKPGEGMPRVIDTSASLSGMTSLGVMPTEEAIVARGLLEAAGIPAATAAASAAFAYTRSNPTSMYLGVAPERAEEAVALLHGEGLHPA
ncbi:MAG TPA: hypothetical protein VFQ85_17070 [Mycobacteriales bacterium]|jgi:hypothetical protein|nr:hypothetical protein [Mycobacteriales bacterium]